MVPPLPGPNLAGCPRRNPAGEPPSSSPRQKRPAEGQGGRRRRSGCCLHAWALQCALLPSSLRMEVFTSLCSFKKKSVPLCPPRLPWRCSASTEALTEGPRAACMRARASEGQPSTWRHRWHEAQVPLSCKRVPPQGSYLNSTSFVMPQNTRRNYGTCSSASSSEKLGLSEPRRERIPEVWTGYWHLV